jgi:hypothetical protein
MGNTLEIIEKYAENYENISIHAGFDRNIIELNGNKVMFLMEK